MSKVTAFPLLCGCDRILRKLPLHLFRNEVIKLPKLWVNRIFYYFMRKRWRGDPPPPPVTVLFCVMWHNIWSDSFQATSCRSRRFSWRVRRLFLCLLRRLNWIRRLFLCLFFEWVYSYFLWLLTWVRDGHVLNPQWNVNKLPLHLFRNEVIK